MKLILNKRFDVLIKEFKCPVQGCPLSFSTPGALKAHLNLMH